MPPVALVDPATFDTSRVIADREAIRRGNPQRFEMEQLTAIIHLDPEEHLVIGYKDVEADEFWVRGHMPGYPLLPGVLMCEAAAQLASYYCHIINLAEGEFHRLWRDGGRPVPGPGPSRRPPGPRLQGHQVHRRQTVFETQGFVGTNMVYHGRIIGVPLPKSE